MHMLCKKDFSSDEMDTLRRSSNPTTVVTPNGEVQTNEEAQVYVHDLDLFVTVKITRGHASSSVTWKGSAKKMEIPTSGPALKHHGWGDPLRDLPEWLQDFTENLEDTETPVPAHGSHDSDSEPLRKWYPSQGSTVFEHTSKKKRNCELCLRTKMTRAPCRRRTGDAVPRATEVGDLKTAAESRNNHRYAVVVQDLATQWIQSYPCKKKTSQETERSSRKFLQPSEQLKVIYCDNSWNLAHSVKIYHGITELQHLLDLRRTVLLKELHAV